MSIPEVRPGRNNLSNEANPLRPTYNVLEIVGDAGTGTTSAGRLLAELHSARFISIGDFVGNINRSLMGGQLINGREIDAAIDVKMDRLGEIIIRNSTSKSPSVRGRSPVIVDSRMGAFLAFSGKKRAEEEGRPYPQVVNIRLTADEEVRISRISRREGQALDDVRRKTIRRDQEDKEAYTALQGKDVYADNLFDLTVDNTNLTVDETAVVINTWLRKNGHLT